MVALRKLKDQVVEFINLEYTPEAERDQARYAELSADTLVQYAYMEALAGILNPGVKLWNTGVGANMMREAVALVGGYGITEDCPGFLMQKWTDCQLEATYEGPEAVQRRHMTMTMTSEVFLATFDAWIKHMERAGKEVPGLGGTCSLPPWNSGSGPSNSCRTTRMPKDASCSTTNVRVSPSRWPMHSAGCAPRTSSPATSWN